MTRSTFAAAILGALGALAASAAAAAPAVTVGSIELHGSGVEHPLRVAPAAASAKKAARIALPEARFTEVRQAKRVQVGFSRAADLPMAAGSRDLAWRHEGGIRLAEIALASPGAAALRVGLRIAGDAAGIEVLASGNAGEPQAYRFPGQVLRALPRGATFFTPLTHGDEQLVRLAFTGAGEPPAVTIEDLAHLVADPLRAPAIQPKALSCHENFACVTDPAMREAGQAVAKLLISVPGGTYLCSGALVRDSAGTPTPWFATAHHCAIDSAAIAASTQFIFDNEQSCDGATNTAPRATVGAEIAFNDAENDFSLLRLTGPVPAGTRALGWSSADVTEGEQVSGIHHPDGSFKRFSTGRKIAEAGITVGEDETSTFPVPMQLVQWTRGATEGGSSGSPLLAADGRLLGTLSVGSTVDECTTRITGYSLFSNVYPRVRRWLDPIPPGRDDWPDSPALADASQGPGYTNFTFEGTLFEPSDQDFFKINVPQPGVLLLGTTDAGGVTTNTFGRLLDGSGRILGEDNDSGSERAGGHFFLGGRLPAGTYYLRVTGFNGATGPYSVTAIYASDDDHSDLSLLATPLGVTGTPVGGGITKYGDIDWFVMQVPGPGTLEIRSTGPTDVRAVLVDNAFEFVGGNDDAGPGNRNFTIRANVTAGAYGLAVLGYDFLTRGDYSVTATFTAGPVSTANLTGLWWNPAESGWGINFNHQSDIVFATLFTYASDGSPMWLVASDLRLIAAEGAYTGTLYRVRGPSYASTAWGPVAVTPVGTMRLVPAGANVAIEYTVNGTLVRKTVERQVFTAPVPTCTAGAVSRASATNYQDLWWNPEENGWGVNFAHQGNLLFGTLFTYGTDGQDRWFVASGMTRQADGSFSGALYSVTGTAFNASPWGSVALRQVGSLAARFANGEAGTLTYIIDGTTRTRPIVRQVFGAQPPTCR